MTPLTDNERIALAVLVTDGRIDALDAEQLLEQGLAAGTAFPVWLSQRIPARDVLATVAEQLRIDHVDFGAARVPYRIEPQLVDAADLTVLRRYAALPLRDERDGAVVVASAYPLDVDLAAYVRSTFPGQTRLGLASQRDIDSKLVFLEAQGTSDRTLEDDTPDRPGAVSTSSPALDWIEATLNRGVVDGASDIHFWWDLDGRLNLKMRVDGTFRAYPVPLPRREHREAISALLAKCESIDSTNVREPIDATFSFEAGGARIDVRLGLLPQQNGPTTVLRLLDSRSITGSLDRFGLADHHVETVRGVLAQPQGMMVVTGPTGSGKSTTLYTCLSEIDAQSRNVHTVEDPVEYRLPFINQTQVRDDLGEKSVTFSRALRTILRLDPDVILVGEMRDEVTARTALNASLTGHLVLTTLHTNTAVQTYTRLIEMGAQPFLVADAISCSVAQRLIRTVHDCAGRRPANDDERQLAARHGVELHEVPVPVGCDGCAQTGFKGRAAVMEVLTPDEQLRELARSSAPLSVLEATAAESGFLPMMHDGLRLVAEGQTSLTEVRRGVHETGGA